MRDTLKNWYTKNKADLKFSYYLLHFPALIFCGVFAVIYKNPCLIPATIFLYIDAFNGITISQEERYAADILNSIEEEDLENFIRRRTGETENHNES